MKRLLLLFSITLGSCKGKPGFYPLPLNSGLTESSDLNTQKTVLYYTESVLVSDAPNGKEDLKLMMLNYQKSKGYAFQKNKGIALYNISFFQKNRRTAYFLKHKEDPGGFSSHMLGEEKEDQLGSLLYQPCTGDSSKWKGVILYGGRYENEPKEVVLDQCSTAGR